MDPADERRDSKRKLEYINLLGNVADSEYGMPRRCACGGRMIDEVRVKDEFDTQPGKRFFSCVNYEADGLHYRQPWVCDVQEEIVTLRKRVEEADEVMKSVPMLNKQIESVEAQVKRLSLLLDKLTGDVYNLTVQVAALERVKVVGCGGHGTELSFPSLLSKQSQHNTDASSIIYTIHPQSHDNTEAHIGLSSHNHTAVW
ncbi:hypothetical protein Bca52824_000406 [Brassica carinata]|uniref:GRF zinc finger containing protein n=1 Tax=Brassica carinata TaxID=52824 RepID=A0A8X7WGH2_BRACI|nr:hypothetical protein Bca52824_000406 [Brassica carinata]